MLAPGLDDYAFNAGFLRRGYGLQSFGYDTPMVSANWRRGVTNYLTTQLHGEASEHLGLIALTLPMLEVGQSHLAYPVLHCVHSRTREAALAPSVAVLDEAITLFAGVCPEQRPDKGAFYPLRQAVAEFLSTLAEAHLEPKGEPPPVPSLDPLREAGITTVKDEEFRLALETLRDRRRLLLGLVEEEAWSWEDVTRSSREIVKRLEISDL